MSPQSRIQKFRNSDFWYAFSRDWVAIGSTLLLLVLLIGAFGAPFFAPHNPYDLTTLDIMDSLYAPAWMDGADPRFPLGTDDQGRDILSVMLYGMRVSLIIGIGAVLIEMVLGIVIGLIAGYGSARVDSFLMRVADIQLSFSSYMVAIFFGAVLIAAVGIGRYEQVAVPFLMIVIGLSEWPKTARTVRGSVLAEKKKEYVEAARVIGLSPLRIVVRHILPNCLTPVLVISTVQVAQAVMSEAALSFIGLGMPATQPSLGTLIRSGFQFFFSGSWWITLFPGVLLILLSLAINLLGDWLRDYLNPKLYKD